MADFTLRQINEMSPEVYRDNCKSSEFRDLVNSLSKPQADVPKPDAEVLPEPVVLEPTPAPVPVINEYRYQPTDELGRKLGGEQVIRYTTGQELAEKLRDQNILLVRKLREVTRKQMMGQEDEQAPANVATFEGPMELTQRDLSAEERFLIAQDLQDPEKFNEGRDRLLESAFGVKPEVLRNRINTIEQRLTQREALDNYSIFISEVRDYTRNSENDATLTQYMMKHGINPTVEGFKYAHEKVKAAGLLLDTPPVQEATVPSAAPVPSVAAVAPVAADSQPSAANGTRIGSEEPPQTKRQVSVPSGLNDRVSSNTAPRSEGIALTLRDINAMTPEQYKAKLRDPAFVKLVNTLEKEALERRKARMMSV